LFHAPYWLYGSLTSIPAALRTTLSMFPDTAMIKTEVYHNESLIKKGSLGASARAILSKLGIDECFKGTTTSKSSRLLEKMWRPYLPDSITLENAIDLTRVLIKCGDSTRLTVTRQTLHRASKQTINQTWNYSLRTSASRSSRKNNPLRCKRVLPPEITLSRSGQTFRNEHGFSLWRHMPMRPGPVTVSI